MTKNGTLETIDGQTALRFERHLPHSVHRVWRAVSAPTELAQWFPAAADWKPTEGEVFEAGGASGEITRHEPPHILEWTFDGQTFHFELSAEGEGCALVFTHIFGDRAISAQTAAGWDSYFDRLDALLACGAMSEERAHSGIGERHERYAARFGVDPARGRAFIAGLAFRDPTLEDGPVLRLERHYDQPIERVWRALTEPEQLRQWFPGELDVTDSDAPRLLVGTWQGEGTLRFELAPEDDGCVLVFTHEFTDPGQAALAGAGWDRCFARLEALLAEAPMSDTQSLKAWPEVHERLAAAWGIDPEIGRKVYADNAG